MTLSGHEGAVRSVAYSSDGQLLVSGSDDGTVRIWDTRTGDEVLLPRRSDNGWVISVDFARNNKWVAFGTQAGVVCIWEVKSSHASHRQLSGHSDSVTCVAFAPDCSRLASASRDHTTRLWNPETGEQLAVLNGHTDSVNGVAFYPDGAILASVSGDRTIRLWDCATGQAVSQPLENAGVSNVDISPDGAMIAGAIDDTVKLQIGEQMAVLRGESEIRSIRFSPDSRTLVAAHAQNVRVWTLKSDSVDACWVDLRGHTRDVRSLSFSLDNLYIASTSDDGTIRIWSTGSSQTAVQPLPAHDSPVHSVAVSRDRTFIVSGSEDTSVRVWDARTGEETLPPLRGHTNQIQSVSISLDKRLIASASQDSTIRLWDAQSGAAVGEPMRGHASVVNAVSFLANSRGLASASDDKTVRVWDVSTQQELDLGPLRCHDRAHAVDISLDGRFITAGDISGRIYLWRTDTGQQAHEPLCEQDVHIFSVAFSPDVKRIVSSGSNNVAHIWDIGTRHLILVLRGHTSLVRSVAWSRDGRLIVTGSDDATLRLWNAKTGAPLTTLHGHVHAVRSVAVTPDSDFIVSGSEDTTIRKWDVPAVHELASEQRSGRVGALVSATLVDGWIVGSSGELILWVPAEYRTYLQIDICTLVVGRSRVVIGLSNGGLHAGSDWISCWRD